MLFDVEKEELFKLYKNKEDEICLKEGLMEEFLTELVEKTLFKQAVEIDMETTISNILKDVDFWESFKETINKNVEITKPKEINVVLFDKNTEIKRTFQNKEQAINYYKKNKDVSTIYDYILSEIENGETNIKYLYEDVKYLLIGEEQ